jgi:transcriptional regulator with XRE-family HTH domain
MGHMTTPTEVSRRLSEAIKEAARTAGLTQRDLADRTGIPLVTINRKLNHTSPFNAVELGAISEALDISLVELALRAERIPAAA